MDPLYIEIVGSSAAPAELPRQGKLVIGSSPDRATFVVDAQGVAEVHCAVGRIKGGGWALRDLGSEFGTLLNGEPVEAARLSEGDEILLGSQKLRIFSLASKGASPQAAPAPAVEPVPESTSAPAGPSAGPPLEESAEDPEELVLEPAPEPRPVERPRARSGASALPEIAGYTVDRLLGRGAMGDVYLSTQESLDRRVALKVLKPKLAGDEVFVRRFRDEARAAARLNHPNIVTVFDVGESSGRHFLSMEFMAGGSIENRLEELGPLPWREALDVLRDAAAGLVYAESRGIVHRDIKPENLMRNQDGVTKIADLGLAVQVEQETVDSSGGKIFGTPHFIAPEVARGQPADARGDLYALGVTAYRVLSGRTPFEGATSRDILRAAMSEEPERLGALVPGLPARLEEIVHRLLEKDPDQRPPSASILLKDLELLRSGGGAAAAQAAPAQAPRSRLGLVLGAAVVAAVGGIALLSGGSDPAPEPEPFRGSGSGAPTDVADATPGPEGPAEDGPRSDRGPGGGDGEESGDADPTADPAADPAAPSVTQAAPGVEAEFEYQAERAMLALGEELLTPADRAARLRLLAEQFAGTDAAARALEEAAAIESGSVAASEVAAARTAALEAAVAALSAAARFEESPFHPGQALRAMNLVVPPSNLVTDVEYVAGRASLVDRALKIGLARGRSAQQAADAAEARGDLLGTQQPLRDFISITDLPTADEAPSLVGPGAPASLEEFRVLTAEVRTRLDALRGREEEFRAVRVGKERAAVAEALGSGLEADLRGLDLTSAKERVLRAAELTSDAEVADQLRGLAGELDSARSALDALLAGWSDPGWRRQGVLDPRPGASGTAAVQGTAPGALMLEAPGAPERVPLTAWLARTKAMENLFRGRLDRSWTGEEERGILSLLGISATLEIIDAFEPSMRADARRLGNAEISAALEPLVEVKEWAEDLPDTSAERQRAAARLLAESLVARQEGEWALSISLLDRLLEENRATWVVMLLSDGSATR